MRITKGKVVGTVTVLIPDERSFTLGDEDEAALLQAIAEADRDDMTDGHGVIQKIS